MPNSEGETSTEVCRFSSVLDSQDVRAELDRLIRTGSRGSADGAVRYRVLKAHKDRCTFEISVTSVGNGPRSVIGKVYEANRSDVFAAMESIVRSGFGTSAEFAIPVPLAYLPSVNVLLEENIPGTQAMEIFLGGHPEEQIAVARRCGQWLARFHRTAPRLGTLAGPREMHDRIRYWAGHIAVSGGALAAKAESLERKLEAEMPAVGTFEPCAGHGSYMPEHVMMSGRRTVTIDLDEYDVADPARDLAWFIVSLARLGLRGEGSLRAHDRDAEAFLQAYAASGSKDAFAHLPFYKAAECLHRALRDLHKRIPPIPEWTEIMLDEGLQAF